MLKKKKRTVIITTPQLQACHECKCWYGFFCMNRVPYLSQSCQHKVKLDESGQRKTKGIFFFLHFRETTKLVQPKNDLSILVHFFNSVQKLKRHFRLTSCDIDILILIKIKDYALQIFLICIPKRFYIVPFLFLLFVSFIFCIITEFPGEKIFKL